MKAYLIKATAKSDYTEYKKNTGGPPQNIFSVAAATPDWVELEMTDETHGMEVNKKSDADIVAIFMSTPDAIRAYELADYFREQNKTVILGGLHTKFNQEEAIQHADSLLIGEPEEIWETLLNDVYKGHLNKKYERTQPFDLAKLKPYPAHIIDPAIYDYTWSVLVSRGCPHKCEFCLVKEFFDKYTTRPVENIVAEIKELKKLGIEWVELHADNLTVNRKYALELFNALAPLNMNFYGETTIKLADDDELLEAASNAGVKYFLFGLETISKSALQGQGKEFVEPDKLRQQIAKIKSYGIKCVSDFLFGFDEHDYSIFEETLKFVKELDLDEVYPHLVIPFPGSETFRRLEKEGRILTKDWSKYDGSHAVYQPALMDPEDLEHGVWKFWKDYESSKGSIWTKLFGKH